MGLISLPIMLRYGYDRRFASGVIAASGTLAQIIPPSLVLIVMADQLGKSVGDMYAGAFLPGLMLAGLYALFIRVTRSKPAWAPALPLEARTFREPSGSSGMPLARGPGRRSSAVVGHRLLFLYFTAQPDAPSTNCWCCRPRRRRRRLRGRGGQPCH